MGRVQGLHLSFSPGRRFALIYEPRTGPQMLVVHVHAFAEEMNKARRMVALQARDLAARGAVVLVPDLLGCGDSDGDFGDATWTQWVDDVAASTHWLRTHYPDVSECWLWGLRAGCLLAAEAAVRYQLSANMLFWQPSATGGLVLQQFLRLKMAAELLSGGRASVDAQRRALAQGNCIEVAGYSLGPELARGMEAARINPPPTPRRSVWLEVAATPSSELLPASARAATRWMEAGWAVESAVVGGPQFWQTVEIDDAPALIAATTSSLTGGLPREEHVEKARSRVPSTNT